MCPALMYEETKGRRQTTHEPHPNTVIFGLVFRRNKLNLPLMLVVDGNIYSASTRERMSSGKKVRMLYAPSSSPFENTHRDTVSFDIQEIGTISIQSGVI
jgi:hypothetical protein